MSSAEALTDMRVRVQQMRSPSLPNASGQGADDFGRAVRNFLLQLIDCTRSMTPIWGDATIGAALVNNLAIPAVGGVLSTIIRLDNTSGGAASLSGVVAPTATQLGVVRLLNISSDVVNLEHENAGSAVANRFLTPGGAAFPLALNGAGLLVYDPDAGRWRVLSGT